MKPKNLRDLKYRTEMEGNAISDYISAHPVKDDYEMDIEEDHFQQDEKGNIYFLKSYKYTSECNDSTGYNTIHETSDEKYEQYLSAEERAELTRKEYNDNKAFYDKN